MPPFRRSPYFVTQRVGRWRFRWFAGALFVVTIVWVAFSSTLSVFWLIVGRLLNTANDLGALTNGAYPTEPVPFAILIGTIGAVFWVCAVAGSLVQDAPVRSLVAPVRKFRWGVVAKVLALKSVFIALPIGLLMLAPAEQSGVSFTGVGLEHLLWVPPLLLVILFQTTGEDVFFKGYLMHRLGAVVSVVWFAPLVVIGVFVSLHLSNPDFSELSLVLPSFVLMELVVVYLIIRTGGMEVAFVSHFVNNATIFLLIADAQTQANDLTLFVFNNSQASRATEANSVGVFVVSLFWQALFVCGLTWKRSPFCVEKHVVTLPPPPQPLPADSVAPPPAALDSMAR